MTKHLEPEHLSGSILGVGDDIKEACQAIKEFADKATALLVSVEQVVDRLRNWLAKVGV